MNNDYGYNNKYSNKDPKKKRSGKFMEFVVKYNKIGWVLLIVLALYLGRGTLSRTINTFRNWEDIQEAKGDVILMQRLFNADRFYLEDPAEYSDVVVLENGTYSHNLRVGSDITLEQEKFEFENGDVFRHVTLPYVDTLDILDVDNMAVRQAQIERLKKLRANRDNEVVQQKLDAITKAMETGEGNLLELAVEAARARASLGEISYAVEKVCGRHKAVIRSISGVYSSEYSDAATIEEVRKMTADFEKKHGRRPRIMVAKMGQDGHDRGAKVVATGYADMGYVVDVGPLFQTPAETAQDAVDNDVHIVGMSSLAAGHKTLLPQLVEELQKRGRGDIMVIAGGVIPAQDYQFLKDHGAAAIYGPGTPIPFAAKDMLEILNKRLDEEEE